MHSQRKPPPSAALPAASWLMGVLDALDVGIVVVEQNGQLVHLNRLARHELGADSIRSLLHRVASLPPMAQRLPQ